jgi:hypothetical protein
MDEVLHMEVEHMEHKKVLHTEVEHMEEGRMEVSGKKLDFRPQQVKCPDPLGLKCDTITSPRRLVNTFITSNSTEFR